MFALFMYINPNTPEERWKAFSTNIDDILSKLPEMVNISFRFLLTEYSLLLLQR
jgi:hypothetical protein